MYKGKIYLYKLRKIQSRHAVSRYTKQIETTALIVLKATEILVQKKNK